MLTFSQHYTGHSFPDFIILLMCALFIFLGMDNSMSADSQSSKGSHAVCKVCSDKASGFHYGVTSCEGCKVWNIYIE